MMCSTFNGNLCATIVPWFSPTNVSDKIDVISFYNEQFSLVRHIPQNNILIIGGDMNVDISKDKNKKSAQFSK